MLFTDNKSTPDSQRFGTLVLKSWRLHFGKLPLNSGRDETPGQISSSGVPKTLKTIWHKYCVVNIKL